MAGRVSGYVEDLEAGNLVAVVEWRSTGWPGPMKMRDVEAGHAVVRLALADQLGVLGGVCVALADPEGMPSSSQTSWLAPWWSGWAWVRAWVLTVVALELTEDHPRDCRVPASTRTSPSR